MKRCVFLAGAISAVVAAACLSAQAQPAFEVKPLADHISELSIDGGGYTVKVIASTGPDGLLIVDAGQTRTVGELKAALGKIAKEQPDIIISTHSHIEHVGGNLELGGDALIIGHAALRQKLRSGKFLFSGFSDHTIPGLTFTDSLSLFFNGEEIKLLSFAGAHDNCDIVVWFTGSKVVCVGGVSNGRHFPSVDDAGDVLAYPNAVRRLLNILPDDVTIVPGHGEDGHKPDLQASYDMLVETESLVRLELAKGKDLATLQGEDFLKAYEPFEYSYVSRNDWLAYLVGGIQPKDLDHRRELYEPMYYAFRDGGPDSAVALYRQLKERSPDLYRFDEVTLVDMGYRLYERRKYAESIPLFQLAAGEYPSGDYTSRVYRLQGLAHKQLGNTDEAKRNLHECLRLEPDDSQAAEALAELEKR